MSEGNKFKMSTIKLFVHFENLKPTLPGFWTALEKHLSSIPSLVSYTVPTWNEQIVSCREN